MCYLEKEMERYEMEIDLARQAFIRALKEAKAKGQVDREALEEAEDEVYSRFGEDLFDWCRKQGVFE